MSGFDFETLVSRLTLTKTFDYETARPLEACIQTIRALQPRFGLLILLGVPGTFRAVNVSPEPDGAFFDVRTFYTPNNMDWLETASITGHLTYQPRNGTTRVRGQAQLSALHLGLVLALIGLIIVVGLLLNAPEILYIVAFVFVALAALPIYRSYRKLVKAVLAL